MKEILKKIPFIKKIVKNYRIKKEFIYDYNFYVNNNMHAKDEDNNLSYQIILLCHSIEKGMLNKNPRFFGEEKIKNIISNLEKIKNKDSFAYNLGMNTLKQYYVFGEEHGFIENNIYSRINEVLKGKFYNNMEIGAYTLSKENVMDNKDFEALLNNRHSIRIFSSKKVKDNDIEKAVKIAIKSPSACNRQMCKAYNVESRKLKELIIKYGQGFSNFDLDNANFMVITFDVASCHVVGERNQGYFNAGLFSMNLVNSFHSLGIGSCFVQFANPSKEEELLKKELSIPQSERIAVFIAFGYYNDVCTVLHSDRKDIKEIYRKI